MFEVEAKSPEQNLLELSNNWIKIVNRCEILIKERYCEEHKSKFILMLDTLRNKVYQVSSFEELENLCYVLWKLMKWIKKSTKNRIIQVLEDNVFKSCFKKRSKMKT